jgi:XTP/dITP diphosphohydrolase
LITFKFITKNKGKVKELRAKVKASPIKITHIESSYPELQADTLVEVSKHALQYCKEFYDPPFIIEDSGLFIDDLAGFPGPYSAYAFKTIGCNGLLKLAEERSKARFTSVIGVYYGNIKLFQGAVDGILVNPRGTMGFGFDPIFEYKGRTFAEMDTEEKNLLSHRSKSMNKFIKWAQKLYNS